IVTAAAVIVSLGRPTAAPVHYVDEPAFPALHDNPDAVQKVIMKGPDNSFSLVRESPDRWVAPDRANYPVATDDVRKLIVGLADMRLTEPKTKEPDLYGRIEVKDVDAKDAKSRLVRLEGAGGKVLAEAIIGKERYRLTGSQATGTYIRRPGEAQSWLASGAVQPETKVAEWLDDQVVALAGDTLRRIEIRPESGEAYAIARASADAGWQLESLGPDEKTKPDEDFAKLTGALSSVKMEDVKPRGELDWPARHGTAEVTTADGLELTVQLAKIGDDHWALFDASEVEPTAASEPAAPAQASGEKVAAADQATPTAQAKPAKPDASPGQAAAAESPSGATGSEGADKKAPATKLTAEALNQRTASWAYKIPEYLYTRLSTPRSAWLADKGKTS
ncbi:MAG: DUF4340 domain-containing protein, partial [Geminicoccaceae bacterium]